MARTSASPRESLTVTVFLRRVMWQSARRGMNGSNTWMILAILAFGARALRRLAHAEPEVLYRTKVSPADRFVISVRKPK